MIKQIFVLILAFFSFSTFALTNKMTSVNDVMLEQRACTKADPVTSPTFCKTFEEAAKCHCKNVSPVPALTCVSVKKIYDYMIATIPDHTLESACRRASEHQPGTTQQECIDDWNCYRLGGRDSHDNLCSGTGRACM